MSALLTALNKLSQSSGLVEIQTQNFYSLDEHDEIVFLGSKIKCESIIFKECQFNKGTSFRKFISKGSLKFVKCIFIGGLTFDELILGSSFQEDVSVIFENCSFLTIGLKISKCTFHNRFSTSKCSKHNSFLISECIFNQGISINDCNFTDSFKVDKSTFKDSFELKKVNITTSDNSAEFSATSFSELKFISCQVLNGLILEEVKISKKLLFSLSTFNSTVLLDGVYATGTAAMKFTDNTFSKFIAIAIKKESSHRENFFEIELLGNLFSGNVSFFGHDAGLSRNLVAIGKLFIWFTKGGGSYSFGNLAIQTLQLRGENRASNVLFNKITIEHLFLEDYLNYASLQFINVSQNKSSNSALEIKNSFLDNTLFMNCDMSGFSKYFVTNSDLSKIKSSSTRWFYFNHITKQFKKSIEDDRFKNHFENKRDFYLSLREVFRQLKHAMEQQGDKIEVLYFKSSEMKAYRSFLKQSGFFKNWGNKLILIFGSSNDFGLNWFKPLLWCLGFSLLFSFLLVVETSPSLSFSLKGSFSNALNELANHTKLFFHLLNPTHDIEKALAPDKVSGLAMGIDFTSRIFTSFFIFQIITAFRKYSK